MARKRLTKAEGMYKAKTKKWGKTLFIVDVSAVMRNGYVPGISGDELFFNGGKKFYGYGRDARMKEINGESVNTSAIYELFKLFKKYGTEADYIFCFDMVKGLKEKINQSYKRGYADTGSEYFNQVNSAYKVLEDCGFKIMGEDNCDADIMIYKAVMDNQKRYDKIGVITNDHRLSYLINDKVEWLNVASTKSDISKENYALILGCPYNSILLKLAMVGDKKLQIPIKGIRGFGEKKFLSFIDMEGLYGKDILWNEVEIIEKSETLDEFQKEIAIECLYELYPYEPEFANGIITGEVNKRRVKSYLKKYDMEEFIELWEVKI